MSCCLANCRKAFNEVLKRSRKARLHWSGPAARPRRCAVLVNAARLVEGQPALTTRYASSRRRVLGQTVVLNDLSALTTRASKNT